MRNPSLAAAATVRLIEELGGTVAGLAFVIELDDLGGRSVLEPHPIEALLHY